MGYAAEKKKAEKKWGRLKLMVLLIVVALLLGFAIVSIIIPCRTWKYRISLPEVGNRADGEMRIHFLDVGQGDATVIELPDGKIAVVDGGDSSKESELALMRYLYALEVKSIEYLILTHADEDHCGALDVVLDCFEVKNVYLPLASETFNTQYAQFYKELTREEDCQVAYAKNGLSLNGDTYRFTFLHPYAHDVEEALKKGETFDKTSNEHSTVLFLEYNGIGTLLTGDLPAEKEKLLAQSQEIGILNVDISDTEILKVGHHGSNTSTSAELLQALHVETAVISCGENEYGHPHEEVLGRLEEIGATAYRTDKQGSVIISVAKGTQSYTVKTLG